MLEMGLAKVYPCTEFEVSIVPLNGWVRDGVCPNSCVVIALANVLDVRYVFALSNYGANCLRLGMKNCANFGFFGPFVLGGTLKKSV